MIIIIRSNQLVAALLIREALIKESLRILFTGISQGKMFLTNMYHP
jgi:hypothetical protein